MLTKKKEKRGLTMALTTEEKSKFIELRAKGWSFDKISEEMNVSKPTLLKLNGELFQEVKEAQFFEIEGVLEQFKVMRKERLKVHCNALYKAMEEFQKRVEEENFSNLPTDKLLNLIEQLEKRIEKDTDKESVRVSTSPDFEVYFDYIGID